MERTTHTFLERIQQSDEPTKRRWTIGIGIVATGVVTFVWLAYFNNLIDSINREASGQQGSTESALSTMGRGAAVISESLKSQGARVKELILKPQTYTITPNEP